MDHTTSQPVKPRVWHKTEYNLTERDIEMLAIPVVNSDTCQNNITSFDECERYQIDWEAECGNETGGCSYEKLQRDKAFFYLIQIFFAHIQL